MFPETRMRRLRQSEAFRRLGCETTFTPDDLIMPLFVAPGESREEEDEMVRGAHTYSVDRVGAACAEMRSPAVLIFGVPSGEQKDTDGSAAISSGGLVPSAVRAVRAAAADLLVITDLCLCAYMSHGHCGVLNGAGKVDNDATLPLLGQMAKAHAAAGADVVAPSGMMDGQVLGIREALDSDGFTETAIMSYASKFASSFYGPFRDLAHSAPSFGDRRTYQLPPPNRREAVREALLDEREGADWLMVKPALPYLDVIREVREASRLPVAAYQVSGECAMIHAAAEAGRLDEREAVMEMLTAIKRAGADAIITYYAEQVCRWVN